MAHYVQAFVTRCESFLRLPANCRSPHLYVVRRPQGFALLPVIDELTAELESAHPLETPHSLATFYGLSLTLADLGRRLSRLAPVVYFETDYIGGAGTQAAVVWERGTVALGPLLSEGYGAINSALRRIGVQRGDARDEFEALGLGLCRSSREWVLYTDEAQIVS